MVKTFLDRIAHAERRQGRGRAALTEHSREPMWLESQGPGSSTSHEVHGSKEWPQLVGPLRTHQSFALNFKCLCKP